MGYGNGVNKSSTGITKKEQRTILHRHAAFEREHVFVHSF